MFSGCLVLQLLYFNQHSLEVVWIYFRTRQGKRVGCGFQLPAMLRFLAAIFFELREMAHFMSYGCQKLLVRKAILDILCYKNNVMVFAVDVIRPSYAGIGFLWLWISFVINSRISNKNIRHVHIEAPRDGS